MSILKNNRLLLAVEQKIEANLTPKAKEDYNKIVLAGMRLALKDRPNGMIAALERSADPIKSCAAGAVNLVALMSHQTASGRMPPNAMAPASMTLMLNALYFGEKAGVLKVDTEVINKATRIWTDEFFRSVKISPETLNKAAALSHKVMKDPAAMERIRRTVGAPPDDARPNAPPAPQPKGAV